MFYREGNIKDIPVELIEINNFDKPYELPDQDLTFKNFRRYAPIGGSGYAPLYIAESNCGKVKLTMKLRGMSDVEATMIYDDGRYSIHTNNVKRLGFTTKHNSNGLFVEKNAYRIGVGAPLQVGDQVNNRNGVCEVLLITDDSVILKDDKNKTILVRKNDKGAMNAHSFDWLEE
ncbi:hypothetical protein phiAS5_ORF0270 [Aeromonas phage phiAS5]|uniref:Uncharacterized protein n=1 Tax=Aeromonas phage phiAS5 TaxID=879630 RepID=E1A224_9CAUD|nr:hypothetical protein phiAS5_ORF0270 [Aeromonas phage phiAS5]ADM80113.1 hypothetical protein phiAS5_ORF0270 [Aeromonas phage phiAS5]BES53124.1 hypothetical protein [Aeromonas phage phiWae14]